MKRNRKVSSLQRVRRSAAYWTELSIAEFTQGLRRLMGDMKQKDLANAMGVTEAYVSTILRGDENFTIQQMNKIAHHLDAAVHLHVAKRDRVVRWREVSDAPNQADTIFEFPASGHTHVQIRMDEAPSETTNLKARTVG